jgi:hypothetical protein
MTDPAGRWHGYIIALEAIAPIADAWRNASALSPHSAAVAATLDQIREGLLTRCQQAAGTIRGEEPAQSKEMDRLERAAAWRIDQAERQAICAGLDWQDCVRALVQAKRMSPGPAERMGVTL